MGKNGSGDTPAVSAERNAAALRIIRRAKRAGMARDRAYSTSEGIYKITEFQFSIVKNIILCKFQ